MSDRTAAKAGTPGAHTELRRQDRARETEKDREKASRPATETGRPERGRDEAVTPLKPRTPAARIPAEGDEDDLFNDMPV